MPTRDRAIRPCRTCGNPVRLFYSEQAGHVLPFEVEPEQDPAKGGFGVVMFNRTVTLPVVKWVPASKRDPELVVYRKHVHTKEQR